MNWESLHDYDALSQRAASILLDAIRTNPQIALGLPTGRTPVGMYERLVAECSLQYHCFREVVTFNLDEYAGIPPDHPGSYCTFMKQHLFDHVDLQRANTHIPDGVHPDPAGYEREIAQSGGLHLTFLGLGSNGHIAFNEPGTPLDSRTRVVALTDEFGWAQRVAVSGHRMAVLPDNVSFSQAATLPVAGLTALRTLRHGAPLLGKRVLITRPAHQAQSFAQALYARGVEPILASTIVIGPPDDVTAAHRAIDDLAEFGWVVFTSANGVDAFFDRLASLDADSRYIGQTRVAAIGSNTALIILNTKNGKQLFNLQETHPNSSFSGPISISNGVLYEGNIDGRLYAFGT